MTRQSRARWLAFATAVLVVLLAAAFAGLRNLAPATDTLGRGDADSLRNATGTRALDDPGPDRPEGVVPAPRAPVRFAYFEKCVGVRPARATLGAAHPRGVCRRAADTLSTAQDEIRTT